MPPRARAGPDWAAGPSDRQKSFASSLNEPDALINSYEHLTGMPDPSEALLRLRKIASLVKPIMRKRGWKVGVLAEFMPDDPRLLGLNINHGQKICIRLRFTHNPGLFMPIEQCVDTMLHELSHIVWGPHDANFHRLWEELRDEHETLLMKGYTGEGFLTKGTRLGGGRVPPPSELRRLARSNAERRRTLNKSSGQKLGGKGIRPGQDPRSAIVNAIDRRNNMDRGCASGQAGADKLAQQASRNITSTKATEDDANDRAIAEALLELMEEEENERLANTFATAPQGGGLTWTSEGGLAREGDVPSPTLTKHSSVMRTGPRSPPDHIQSDMSEDAQMEWALQESIRAAEAANKLPVRGSTTAKAPSSPPQTKPSKRPRLPSSPKADTRSRQPSQTSMSNSPAIATALSAANGPSYSPSQTAKSFTAKPAPSKPTSDPTPSKSTKSTSRPSSSSITSSTASTTISQWTCDVCTCHNPLQYLACGACGIERPAAVTARTAAAALQNLERGALARGLKKPESLGWSCRRCGTFMEHRYWTCSICGLMKESSRENEHAL